jgi:hypothetical protein
MSAERERGAGGRMPRVMAEQCDTCVFRPGNLMRLRHGRLRDLIQANRQAGAALICHKTTYGQHPELGPTVCRGFYDAYPDTTSMQHPQDGAQTPWTT